MRVYVCSQGRPALIYRFPDTGAGRPAAIPLVPTSSSYIGGLSSYSTGLNTVPSAGSRGPLAPVGLGKPEYTLVGLSALASPGYGRYPELAL